MLQFPNYTQGLNPYTYALNNPLRFVDPDGYSLVGQFLALTISMAIAPLNPWLAITAYSVIMTVDYAIEQGRNVKAGEIYGYFVQTFVMSAISMGATKGIGGFFDQFKNTGLRELGRAVAHGTFNGAMRFAQGGKFEHGFMSGFVSSLGGSFMQANAGNMSLGAKVTMSAVIGGTAEKLGGGKFANGAVTGAYVMMFNHLSKPRPLDLDKASPDQVLKHIWRVGRWAQGSSRMVDEFFIFKNEFYSGTGSFYNFKNVDYYFSVVSGTTLDFSSISISVSDPIIYLNETVVTNGAIDHSDRVLTQAGGGNFSGMMYTINVGGSGGSSFTWVHHNIFRGNNYSLGRVHLEGYRLAGFLTHQFTGKYRQQTEAIPGY